MSASAVVPAVATTGGDVDNGVDLKEEVSDRIEAFARLLDPFAEGSKFTAINDAAVTIGDSNATESDVVAGADDNTGGGKEGGVAAIKIETKVVSYSPLCTTSQRDQDVGEVLYDKVSACKSPSRSEVL